MSTRRIHRTAREESHQGVRRSHRRHTGSSFRYKLGYRWRQVTSLVVVGLDPPTGAGAMTEASNRGCRAAVELSHAKWIVGVEILRLSAVFAVVTCVIVAGISLVNVRRTHRCTVAVAAVA